MKTGEKTSGPVVIRSILVIDDHPLYCDALAATLVRIFDDCTIKTVNNLCEAVRCMDAGMVPDLVMLDLKLPDVTGFSGFFKVREKLPDVPVLVISAESSNDTIQMLMSSGAAGFIPKDASQSVFQDALEKIQEGMKFVPADFRPQASATAESVVTVQQVAQRIADLTPQQSRIMKLICAGKPNKQIAYELDLAEATVKAHITALLRRLRVSNRTQAAMLVNNAGLTGAGAGLSDTDARALLS